MALLSIIVAPDLRLKLKCRPVNCVDDEIRRLMNDMLETMYQGLGIGLAAIQVGIPKRVIVLDVSGHEEPIVPLRMANPKLIYVSENCISDEEGCLSISEAPGLGVVWSAEGVKRYSGMDLTTSDL